MAGQKISELEESESEMEENEQDPLEMSETHLK